jgi:hypothetical protein
MQENHKFLRLQDLPEPAVADRNPPTPEQIKDWISKHAVAESAEKIVLKIGFPEKENLEVPCLAVANYLDHIEILNLDGKTSILDLSEVA